MQSMYRIWFSIETRVAASHWVIEYLVGGLVVKWLVGWWVSGEWVNGLVVGSFNKTCSKKHLIFTGKVHYILKTRLK